MVFMACGTPQPRNAPSQPTRAAGSDAGSADPSAGALQRPSATNTVYPTRVCIDGNDLVFENSCGCNDGLLCRVGEVANETVAVTLTLDPSRLSMCDDCFPMVPARCALPSLKGKGDSIAVAINGQAAFTLALDRAGKPIHGSCWTRP